MRFGDLRAEQGKVVGTDPRHGKLPDDVTAPIQGGGEVDPAGSRQPVGEQPLQPAGGPGAGHAVLGEVGALGEPDALAPVAHSSATTGKALERRNVTSSRGSSPARWNHRGCSSP